MLNKFIFFYKTFSAWKLDLIVTPTSNLPILIFTIILILVSLMVSIVYLHSQEYREDYKENKDDFGWFG